MSVAKYLLSNRLLLKIPLDEQIVMDKKRLIVKKTKNAKFPYTICAGEFIPKNTVIMDSNTYDTRINDLAYHGTLDGYDTEENILTYVNIGCIQQSDILYDFFGKDKGRCHIFYYAIRDIGCGEQLSVFYGRDYWQEQEFWNEFPDSTFRLTNNHIDLPSKWVPIDTVCKNLYEESKIILYGKKIGDKYFYALCKDPQYYATHFPKTNKKFMEITKEDFALFELNDNIHKGLYRTQYLMTTNAVYPKSLPNGTRATFHNPITNRFETKIVNDDFLTDAHISSAKSNFVI